MGVVLSHSTDLCPAASEHGIVVFGGSTFWSNSPIKFPESIVQCSAALMHKAANSTVTSFLAAQDNTAQRSLPTYLCGISKAT